MNQEEIAALIAEKNELAKELAEAKAKLRRIDRLEKTHLQNIKRYKENMEIQRTVYISMQRKLDENLKYINEFLRFCPDSIFLLDKEERFVLASQTFVRFLKIKNKDMLKGRTFLSVAEEYMDQITAERLFQVINMAETKNKSYCFYITTNGKRFSVSIIALGEHDSTMAKGLIVLIHDITDLSLAMYKQKELGKQLQANNIELEKQTKAAIAANVAKSKFLATMSHEIRTPLNAVIGIAQIQLEKTNLGEDTIEAFQRISRSGQHLLGIINDILDLSKIESGSMELILSEYDVPSMVNDTAQLNMVRIGSKPIDFKVEIDEQLPNVLFGDELRVKQILNNILSNAFKYTDKGEVVLRVGLDAASDPEVPIIVFCISDTGQGMKPEDLKKLFSEYSRFNQDANRSTEGTGLGMSITYKLLRMMKGEIDVQSEFGRGSVFTVRIPQKRVGNNIIGAEVAEQLGKFTFSSAKYSENLSITRDYMPYGKVLVVDDVETNLFVARGLLAPYGLEVETAESGFEALHKIIDEKRVYDIVFMDHMMPRMDGIETVSRLRAAGYESPIIALTANAVSGSANMFLHNGFEGFVSKPIDAHSLNDALNKWVRDKQPPAVLAEAASARTALGEEQMQVPLTKDNRDPELLKIFEKDARKALATLKQTLQNRDFKLFTITAHAMKSATANIGEDELAKSALTLEQAGKEENEAFITRNTPGFLLALEALADSLRESLAVGAKEGTVDQPEDAPALQAAFDALREACENYEVDDADRILAELHKIPHGAQTASLIEELSEMLRHSDFEAVVEKLSGT